MESFRNYPMPGPGGPLQMVAVFWDDLKAGSSNTGDGGAGTASAGSFNSGGSGVVILRYPKAFTITVGGSLTSSTATDGDYKVTTFTAGTDNVSWA